VNAPEFSSPETAARVADYLTDHPVASLRDVAEALDIGRNTVHNAVRRLRAEGRLTVERLGTGHRYPTRYQVVNR
jgi:biotin operon repressor